MPRRPSTDVALRRLADLGGLIGRGLIAGAVGTAAMTASSTLEMRLRRRPASEAPTDVAAKLLAVEPRDRARFGTVAHLATGVGLGVAVAATRALLRGREPLATGAAFGVAWTPDLVAVPALTATPPPWRWGVVELAISAVHHVAYALPAGWLDARLRAAA